MQKDCKFNSFIIFLTEFADKSKFPTLVKLYINQISSYSDKELLEYIEQHKDTQYFSLLQQLCNVAMIDINDIDYIHQSKFCTYIYYFYSKLTCSNV